MKKLFYLTMSLVLATFSISCESDDERLGLSEKSTDVFANVCKSTFSSLSDLDIGQGQNGNSPRKIALEKVDSTHTVYVKPSPGSGPAGDLQPFTGKTLKDLVGYVELVGASLTMTNDGTAIDSVNISVTETKEKLKPLVTESYKYLKEFGFSEAELRTMVAENNTTEEALIVLMLTLKECDCNISSGFCSPPKPGTHTKPEESSFIKQAAGCALKAFGFDLVVDLTREILNVGIKNVSRTVLVKVFTKVAKRYCSNVVGIALAAYDWANCMNYV